MGDLLMGGQLPYLGSWDQNFPGIVPIHAFEILLFGKSQLAFRIFDVLAQLSTCWFAMRLASRFGGKLAAFLAPLLVALYFLHQGFWMAGERDTYVTLLLLAAMDTLVSRTTIRLPFILAGVLIGYALLIRPTYVFAALAPFVLMLGTQPLRPQLRNAGRYLLGLAIPWAVILVVYGISGGLREFVLATVSFNTEIYIGQGAVFDLWQPVRFYWLTAIAALFGLWFVIHNRDTRFTVYWGISLAGAIASLLALYRHSVYHYHPAMVLLIVMASIGFGALLAKVKAKGAWSRVATTAGILSIILFFSFQAVRGNTIQFILQDALSGRLTSLEDVYHVFEPSPDFGYRVQRSVGEYLSARGIAGQPVQMFGPYSYPQYLADASTASRFQTLHALVMRRDDAPLTDFQLAWRNEYMKDLERIRPKFFIVCDAPPAFRQYYGGRLGHEILREDFTSLGSWVAQKYEMDTVLGAFTVYRWRE